MKSCRINWKEFICVFLYAPVISSIVIIEGRPQQYQPYHRSYNTFNITLVPFPTPQYQQYHRYNQQQHHYYQNTKASRNISLSNSNNYEPAIDLTVNQHGVDELLYHPQPVIDPTMPQQHEGFDNSRYQPQQKNPVVFNTNNNNNQNINVHKATTDSIGVSQYGEMTGSKEARAENLHRDVRNSTVVQLPASGAGLVTKEKTRILTHHVNPSRGSLSEDLRGSTQDIIFPDSFENLFDPITRLDIMPQCARGALFCEDIPTYPYHQIRDTLRRTSVNVDLFFDDEIDSSKEIANRIGGPEEKFICKSIERTIYPKVGITKNNKWKYIINQNQEGYIQGVRVETCLYADKPCDLSEHMPLGVVTSCKQKYVTRRMMSLADDGVPLPDIFLMPSACCCAYRMENPLLRARNVDNSTIPQ